MSNDITKLPDHCLCTGCGACEQICPKKCVKFEKDEMDAVFPQIDASRCISCGKCVRACHIHQDFFYPKSEEIYAGWSTDDSIRKISASGGIATAIYRYALSMGYKTFGVTLSGEGVAEYISIDSIEDISKVQNSKYVYSYTRGTYESIKYYLQEGKKVIFIGLPCQVAGLLGYLGGRNQNLILIDIICHGVCPEDYLQQHIASNDAGNRINRILFRDPSYGTNHFVFSLYQDDKRLYSSIVHDADVYQLGYHEALIYRENCYNCKYARAQRVGDITISDFGGLGRKKDWNLSRANVSCVICSSDKGEALLNKMQDLKQISLFSRPPEEAFNYEKQLITPSSPHNKRKAFVDSYKKDRDFENTLKFLLKDEIFKNRLKIQFRVDDTKRIIRNSIPTSFKKWMKKIIGRDNG